MPVTINDYRRYFIYARAGYFDAAAVRQWRERFRGLKAGANQRTSVEMELVGVLATQL
jgi:hypothetical protein